MRLSPEPHVLAPDQTALRQWAPKAEIRVPAKPLGHFRRNHHFVRRLRIRHIVEEKRHLRHQDVGVVVDQLNRRRADLPADHIGDRLLLAPHIRTQQAAALERAHRLSRSRRQCSRAPGLFVHVEGRQPAKEPTPTRSPAQGYGSRPSWPSIWPTGQRAIPRPRRAGGCRPRYGWRSHERPCCSRDSARWQGRSKSR